MQPTSTTVTGRDPGRHLLIRTLFDPAGPPPRLPTSADARTGWSDAAVPRWVPGAARPVTGLARSATKGLVDYYRHRLAWVVLAFNAVVLTYLGGLVMFWFHAIHLGEGGPAIPWYAHWLLDSTFGFLALTPALFFLLPLAAWVAGGVAASVRALPWVYGTLTGALFAAVTTPGPIAHDLIVGRGTWIANTVTDMIGNRSAPLSQVTEYPPLAELTQQLGFGIPVYIVLSLASVLVLRRIVRAPVPTGDAADAD
jgi:hypothetical protein